MKLPPPILPTDGVQRLLFEAAWANERLVNQFRGAVCLFILVTAGAGHVFRIGYLPASVYLIAAWAVFISAMAYVLRFTYHRALSFVIATTDILLLLPGQLILHRDITATVSPAEGLTALYGMPMWALILIALNSLRFSWPLALWSTVLSTTLTIALMSSALGFQQGFLWQSMTYGIMFVLVYASTRGFERGLVQLRERDLFARYLPGPLLERVAKDPTVLKLGGEVQLATVLFSDIRGFTELSSTLPPTQVVALLNEYFEQMVGEVFANEGILDKFIGDGLCAVFGPPLSPPEQARRAIACALGMQDRLAIVNGARRVRGEPELKIGIGIHTGPLVAGNIGSSARMEYTHIGDAVNTASRVEGLTKELGVTVLVSRSTTDLLGEPLGYALRELPKTTVKGKAEPLTVFAVTRA